MDATWWLTVWEVTLTLAVILSTATTVFILTLPSRFSHFHPQILNRKDFTSKDEENADRSGYAWYQSHKDDEGNLRLDVSVQVVVLGDIGRSPRMQYHALSIAQRGGHVDLVGYVESDVHPDIKANRLIHVVPIPPFPRALHTSNKLLFLLTAPLKVIWQIWSLYRALGYRTRASNWMLVQNPPSIPTLAVAQFICFFRNTKLVIDWHNFGYSILALRLGRGHPLVRISEWYEGFCSKAAFAHFAVTTAMVRVLKDKWGVEAIALHDRPPTQFQPLTHGQRMDLLWRLPETSPYAEDINKRSWRLIVSSTSWTPDEDFSLLLDALVSYSASAKQKPNLPRIMAIITGKGPQKQHYIDRIRDLQQSNKLQNVIITTAWLSTEDYASLLGSADLGISLHTSSSGVDLPMKVVDMFGTGLPVAGWGKFEAWPELVREGVNGRGFDSAASLAEILEELFGGDGIQLARLKEGALQECEKRWDDEWMPVAGQMFKLSS